MKKVNLHSERGTSVVVMDKLMNIEIDHYGSPIRIYLSEGELLRVRGVEYLEFEMDSENIDEIHVHLILDPGSYYRPRGARRKFKFMFPE
jgi:hypothetical protein